LSNYFDHLLLYHGVRAEYQQINVVVLYCGTSGTAFTGITVVSVDYLAGRHRYEYKSDLTGRDGFIFCHLAQPAQHELLSCEHAKKHRTIVKRIAERTLTLER